MKPLEGHRWSSYGGYVDARRAEPRVDYRWLALLCCRYARASQRAVAGHFGYRGNGSVAKQRQKLRELLPADKRLQAKLTLIEKDARLALISNSPVCP